MSVILGFGVGVMLGAATCRWWTARVIRRVGTTTSTPSPDRVGAGEVPIIRLEGTTTAVRWHGVPLRLGRDASMCAIALPEDTDKVSREHCEVHFNETDGVFVITDLGSANGTMVRGSTLLDAGVPTRVLPGSSLALGDTTAMVRLDLIAVTEPR